MKEKKEELFNFDAGKMEGGELNGKYRLTWTEESIIFTERKGKQIALPQSGEYIGSSFSDKKKLYFLFFLIFIFLCFLSRIMYLQILKGETYRGVAEGNRQRIISIPAERGLIFDRNNIPLVRNVPNFYLTLVPQDLPREKEDRTRIVERLAEITKQTKEKISAILEEYMTYSYESIVIEENLDYETALIVQIQAMDLPGVQIQYGSKRQYLDMSPTSTTQLPLASPSSLAHILGYEGKLDKEELSQLYPRGYVPSDYIGKTGLEKSYESVLRGIYGKKRIEVDALGKEQNVLAEQAPQPGSYLKLSIDTKMQKTLEKIINRVLKANNKHRAVGIVMNPNNGEILALVSLPTFNNNDFTGKINPEIYTGYVNDENKPLFNRAIAGTYPSGSTIKPVFASAALQEGIIDSKTTFLSTGGITVDKWFFPDWLKGGHGPTNVRYSLAWSVNTFYYYIGGGYGNLVGLGIEKLTNYLRKFGFAEKLGIDLPSEKKGFLPSSQWKERNKNEPWYIGDTYNLSIGQGDILVTPLQISTMTATIANGGTIYRPRVVKSTIDPLTKIEKERKAEVIRSNFINSSNLSIVRQGMRDCVIYGSCRRLGDLPIMVAGKTGTAQWSKNKNNHAWFTSFAPYQNPEIVVTILIEEGGEGSNIAAPIAYDFYNWWANYRQVKNLTPFLSLLY